MRPLEIGAATRMVITKWELQTDIENVVLGCLDEYHHQEWYWTFMDWAGLTGNIVYELSVAMHLDAHIAFDHKTCTVTPFTRRSPSQ